jgi:very-long-chain enoyl-CoA reductase
MYFFLHPDYTAPKWATNTHYYIILAAFVFFEFMNFMCHLTLKNLRKPGSTERGIPKGWGFDQVSSANYLWETLSWLMFAIQSQVLGGK